MSNKKKIINDPVFGFISIPNELVYDVLQHPFVQRLSRIRQLGLSYFVYPGALHSRFLHSLGAMHLMGEAITSLRQKGVPITEEESTAAMIGILLHDIGHGPFSHVLEHTLVSGITHEDISLKMMETIGEEIQRKDPCGEHARTMATAIAIFKDEYPKHFLHQLVSSQLDVDRLDYLCRDSFFCGVTEGSVASARILKMLHVVDDRLVVEAKGIYSVEKFLVARRLMYWQVYLHKTGVGAELLLIKLLTRAKEVAAGKVVGCQETLFCSPALHYFLYNNVTAENFDLHQYALLDDSDVLSAVKAWTQSDDRVLRILCEAFINRRLFKARETEYPLTEAEKKALRQTYAGAMAVTEEEAAYFFEEHVSASRTYSEKDDTINILYNDGRVKDIAEASEILDLEALTRRPEKRYLYKFEL